MFPCPANRVKISGLGQSLWTISNSVAALGDRQFLVATCDRALKEMTGAVLR